MVENVDSREVVHVWGQGIYQNSLYFPLSFIMNLTLLQKIKFINFLKSQLDRPRYEVPRKMMDFQDKILRESTENSVLE